MSENEPVQASLQSTIPNIIINNTNTNTNNGGINSKPRSKIVTLILCIFFGWAGLHRFYSGNIITALIYMFSFGLLGVGVLLDLLYIIAGTYRDANGVPLA